MPYQSPQRGEPWTPRELAEWKAGVMQKELLSNRPDRQTVISPDDCLNVRIALETSKDINDFIERM